MQLKEMDLFNWMINEKHYNLITKYHFPLKASMKYIHSPKKHLNLTTY